VTGDWDHAGRIARAREGLTTRAADALLIGVGADLVYLTGYIAMPLERLTMLVLPRTGTPALFAPRLEAMAAAACPAARAGAVEVVAWDETDSAHGLVAARLEANLGHAPQRVLVSGGLWAMHVLELQGAMPGAGFGLASEVMRDLRMIKDDAEIDLLRAAARAADRVVEAVAAGPLTGRTEADISREVLRRLVEAGHDEATFAIVASGPNSASPHHEPGERLIQPGDPIVLDIGGTVGGYGSDITRTLWVTGPATGPGPAVQPDPGFLEIHGLVRRAQAAATNAVRPGTACEALDAVARELITAGGFGSAFLHRLGHGIGLEGHEEPYLVAGNAEPLRPGMAFSIEPGIYLADRWGVRIEDIVVCGGDGPIVLNEAPRELLVVPG
jgi:Xaa-Pro aminopeptidase